MLRSYFLYSGCFVLVNEMALLTPDGCVYKELNPPLFYRSTIVVHDYEMGTPRIVKLTDALVRSERYSLSFLVVVGNVNGYVSLRGILLNLLYPPS